MASLHVVALYFLLSGLVYLKLKIFGSLIGPHFPPCLTHDRSVAPWLVQSCRGHLGRNIGRKEGIQVLTGVDVS